MPHKTSLIKAMVLGIVVFVTIFVISNTFYKENKDKYQSATGNSDMTSDTPIPRFSSNSLSNQTPQPSPTPTPISTSLVFYKVPFTSQAPLGNWGNDVYQDGCEETSAMMAMAWVTGKSSFNAQEANDEIKKISDFELARYGEYHDRSAKDTTQLIKDYYGYNKVEFKAGVSLNDLISALEGGSILIVPMNGQTLGNPHYTQPGPARHMLVVIGYDPKKHQFITNDPGTRYGASYRYDQNTFFNAIRDYTTGNGAPIEDTHKDMIIISK